MLVHMAIHVYVSVALFFFVNLSDMINPLNLKKNTLYMFIHIGLCFFENFVYSGASCGAHYKTR